jgi:hypothetical protein
MIIFSFDLEIKIKRKKLFTLNLITVFPTSETACLTKYSGSAKLTDI